MEEVHKSLVEKPLDSSIMVDLYTRLYMVLWVKRSADSHTLHCIPIM